MFVVNFMCPSHAPGIPIVDISEYFETLVDKDIVHHKVCDAVGQNTKTQGPTIPKPGIIAQREQYHAHNSVKDEKGIIALEPGVMVLFVVIFVETP